MHYRYIAHGDFLFAAKLCGWPRLPGLERTAWAGVAGETAWRDVLASMATPERQRLLSRLARRELLVCTPGGRRHLRVWLDRQWARPTDDDPAEPIRNRLTRTLRIYGDDSLAPAIIDAFTLPPRPVRDMVAEEAYVLAVGGRLRGWTSAPLPAGVCPIQVSGATYEEVVSVTLHELAHRWNAAPLEPGVVCPTVREHAAFLEYARRERWPVAEVERRTAEDEQLARVLALAWDTR